MTTPRKPVTTPPPAQSWPGVVVLSGPALLIAAEACRVATRARRLSGLPVQPFDALGELIGSAMSPAGHRDVPESPCVPTLIPTVPIAEAAQELGLSLRQTRRLAPVLGGRKFGGRLFVDRTALDDHKHERSQS